MSGIKLFNDKKIGSEWNEEEEQLYFSIQDVVEVLTDGVDIKQYKTYTSKRYGFEFQLRYNLYPS